ncbi:YraN family protein [Bacteroidales bacterium OttesenSCG-928-M11]|nr:YraN family protein [Bacteroidales bacterium OttesenSCG-928-M11]
MALHNDLGKSGEEAVIEYLKNQDYLILHHNWRWKHLELDIIAQQGDELVVVEVKTRTDNFYSDPYNAVTPQKINNIVTASHIYIKTFQIDLPVRFDIISIIGYDPYFEFDHIEDAFHPPLKSRHK